ncbi:MAG: MvdD family ATP-grasp ribosomal peptide maturase [Crocinitomix sp.]|nr:MvdD family ATP-grasp ribosomal peptide maturase [Crocinitomix sp.]
MKNKVLIITHTQDNPCVEKVSEAIARKGGQVVRLNVDRYPIDYRITTLFNKGKWEILLADNDGAVHNLTTEFLSLWNRRIYNLGSCLEEVLEKKYLNSSIGESNATLIGMLSHLEHELFTLNSYSENKRSGIKEKQLRIADQCGLTIPRTCISNDFEQVKAFVKSCPNGVIAKMQHAFSIYEEGVESVVFTNEIGEADLEDLEAQLRLCPMKFQEKIEKKLELRITIIGKRVFAAALDSQLKKDGEIDWRKVGQESIGDWKSCSIPDDLKANLLRFHEVCNLNYGASDVILTPEGEYIFLESNPGGEFFWLDEEANYAISDEIASLLVKESIAVPHVPTNELEASGLV